MGWLNARTILYLVVILIHFDFNSSLTTIDPWTVYSSTEEEVVAVEIDLSKTLLEFELAFGMQIEYNTSDTSNDGLTFVNWLKRQYLKLEQQLWSEIEYHSKESTASTMNDAKSDLLEMLRISHLVFFNGNFRENAIDLNLFDAHDEILFDCITAINRSVQLSKETYLNRPEMLQNELNTISIVQDQLELQKTLDNIYKFISSNHVYMRSVSLFGCFCFFFVLCSMCDCNGILEFYSITTFFLLSYTICDKTGSCLHRLPY